MESTVRLRLLFEDEGILTDRQKSDGLDRCWILLPGELATVSDLSSHLTRSFSLQSSCPDGLILSMDEFALPTFESIRVLKDGDLLRIWKKDAVTRDAIAKGDTGIVADGGFEVVEKRQPLLLRDNHFVTKDSGRESIDNLVDVEADADGESNESDSDGLKRFSRKISSRKRKRSNLKKSRKVPRKLQIVDPFHVARRKKIKLKRSESHVAPVVQGMEESFHVDTDAKNLEKNSYNNGKLPNADHELEEEINIFINGNSKDAAKSKLNVDRSIFTQEETQNGSGGPQDGSSKKFPSRSSRRKKAKRRFRRELANSEKEMSLHDRTGNQTCANNERTSVVTKEKEFVPVMVTPGHIRFELSDADEEIEHRQGLKGTIQWNGTLDKRRGQKWGREKASASEKSEKVIGKVCGKEGSDVAVDPTDFEKLSPLMGLPKVGDVVAYRLVELTSSWCPEISTFRIGKVSFFDPETRNSILVPITGYPVPTENANKESEMEPCNSLYKEDGSIEIEFTSLIDVRLFKESSPKTMAIRSNELKSKDETGPTNGLVSTSRSGENMDLNHAAPASTGKEIVSWDEISEALNKKKAELLQKDTASCSVESLTAQKHATKQPGSYRALRRSALGPTISLLRANNQL